MTNYVLARIKPRFRTRHTYPRVLLKWSETRRIVDEPAALRSKKPYLGAQGAAAAAALIQQAQVHSAGCLPNY